METSLEIRLECLRLAHRHDRPPTEVAIVAKAYEDFVLYGIKTDTDKEKKPGNSAPKASSKK